MPQYFSFGLEQSVLDNQVAWTDTKQSFDFAKPLKFFQAALPSVQQMAIED